MKAVYIKAETMELKIIDLIEGDDSSMFNQIHELLGVSSIDYAFRSIENKAYYFMVDDVGLNKEDFIISAWSPDRDSVLAGNLIISKTNYIGELEELNSSDVERIERNIDEVMLKDGTKKKILLLD